MAFMEVTKGATSQSIPIEIKDSSVTTGAGLTGLAYNTAGLTAYYWRAGGTATAITLATLAAVNSAYSSGGFKEVDATNMPGMYRLDVPNAAFATGANWVVIELKGASNMAQCRVFIELCGLDKQDTVRAGLTGLANATPGASGGLLIAGTNSGATTFSAGMTISSGSGNALTLTSSGGNGDALELNGNGSGAAIDANAGATGVGIDVAGGATSGDAFKLVATSGHGLLITPGGNGKHGIAITVGTANNATGITITGSSGTGACHGILVTSGSNAANTGSALKLDGSVASAGFSISGGSTSGDGIVVTTTSGHGVTITAAGSSKHGITSTGGTSGNGMTLVAGSGGATLDSTTTAAIGTAVWATGTRVLTAGTNIALAKGTGVTGFNDIAATDVWAAATRTLTSGANIALAKGTGVTGFNDLATSDIDARLAAIGLDHLVQVAVTGTDITDNSIVAKLVSKSVTADWDTYANTTDSLEALRDRGDAAWITATGFSTHTAADVWAVATRVLTAGTNIVLAKGTGVTGFNDIQASDVWNVAVPGAFAAGTAGYVLGTNLNATVSSRGTDTGVWAAATRTLTSGANIALAKGTGVTGFNDIAATDVWAATTRTLSAGTNIVLAKGTGITGFNDLATSDIDARLAAIGLDHLVQVAVTGTDITDNSIVAKLVSKSVTADWDTYANTTDSLEALRDRGDAAWITATGFSTHTAADVWAVATRVLTAGTNIALAKGTGVTGFNDPTVAEIADAVWDEAISGHLTAGTTGAALNAAGSAGDPWSTLLPGAYGAGTAGYIVGTNLNATVSSRGTDTGVWAAATRTLTSGANIALAKGTGVTGFNDIAATDVWAATTRTLSAGTNIVLAKGTGVTGFNDLSAAQVNAEVDTALADIHLDHLIGVADPGSIVANNSFLAKLVSKSATAAFTSYNNTTDSLEALRDRGDAAWITATGFSTHTAADVWSVGTRTLTSGANIALAKGTGVTGFNDLATSDIDARLAAIGLDHLVQVAVTGTDITDNSIVAKLVSKSATADWDTYNNTTDSHEALRDRGDAAWITATGFSTHTAADVWAVATRVLTAGTNIVLAKGTGVTGFNDIAATDVWSATTRTLSSGANIVLVKGTGVTGFNDLATSDIDARLAAIGLDHLVQVAVTGTDVTDNSIVAKLVSKSVTADWDSFDNTTDSQEALRDNLATATALAAAKTVCDSILVIVGTTGVAIASATQRSIADTLLTRNVSNVEATAAEHTLCTVILASLEMAISGTTMTIKRTDGTTTHVTKTVTKVTSDDPIRGVN